MYLVAVSDATGGAEEMVLENIVQYASTDLRHVLMAKHDNNRMDYLRHAKELEHFVQAIKTDVRGTKTTGKDVVLHVEGSRQRTETRTCFTCNKVGHVATDFR